MVLKDATKIFSQREEVKHDNANESVLAIKGTNIFNFRVKQKGI